jgi:tetratricopeptide (TPR) repeat protein
LGVKERGQSTILDSLDPLLDSNDIARVSSNQVFCQDLLTDPFPTAIKTCLELSAGNRYTTQRICSTGCDFMMRDRLAHAIQLREKGRAKQDQCILEEARTLLLELVVAYPDDAEINFQAAVVHDNLGLERESIPFYLRALGQGLSGPSLERCLLGLGSTYRVMGEYQKAEETLRLGVREFPDNRALQVFLAITLYNTQQHKEAMELVLVNLLETTSDEKLQYFKRGLLYYTLHLDEPSQ